MANRGRPGCAWSSTRCTVEIWTSLQAKPIGCGARSPSVGLGTTITWHETVQVAAQAVGRVSNRNGGQESPPLSVRAKAAVEHAVAMSDQIVDFPIGIPHMLLGLLTDDDCGAARTLLAVEVDLDELRARAWAGLEEDTYS